MSNFLFLFFLIFYRINLTTQEWLSVACLFKKTDRETRFLTDFADKSKSKNLPSFTTVEVDKESGNCK